MITRRTWLGVAASAPLAGRQVLDRHALVARHNPVLTGWDPRAPLSVGNGEFAFTADLTGLQTFQDFYLQGIPLCTMSQWGWHTAANPKGFKPSDLKLTEFDTAGRKVGYPTGGQGQAELFAWLRQNPHRLHLGRIGFVMLNKDGRPVARESLRPIRQELDLWSGSIHSTFTVNGDKVDVVTCCHPQIDALTVRVESGLLQKERLSICLEFPYGSHEVPAVEWSHPDAHSSAGTSRGDRGFEIHRVLDNDRYSVRLRWDSPARVREDGKHRFLLVPSSGQLSAVFRFSPTPIATPPPSFDETLAASRKQWSRFWQFGGAIDLSSSTDLRAKELERRIVLSQYLTAIQCSGSLPPQETGLTCNSWYGKLHLEMHWWHAAHFPLWDRLPMLERSLGWYEKILPSARETAKQQGYRGARWPKMVGPEGRDSPSPIGPLLIWQQPHLLYFAELVWRVRSDKATLQRYAGLVQETAEFMASFPIWEEAGQRFVLGPPVIPAQENHPARNTWNPTFELAYWAWGLEIAQQWRQRLGQSRVPGWERVRRNLSALPSRSDAYLAHENCPQTYTERNRDHPSMLMALGFLPGEGVDRDRMRRTLQKVFDTWRWPDTWGWDYPMVAMTAARLGESELAVDALMMETPKNVWLPNGHNYQRANLQLYLPGNGGLLAAVAMMAAAWDGFPRKGWIVRHEGLRPLL